MYVTYQYPIQVHGVSGLHYVADPNMLASGRDHRPNRCFCPAVPEDAKPKEEKKVVQRPNTYSLVFHLIQYTVHDTDSRVGCIALRLLGQWKVRTEKMTPLQAFPCGPGGALCNPFVGIATL